MTVTQDYPADNTPSSQRRRSAVNRKTFRRRLVLTLASLGGASLIVAVSAAWLGIKAAEINFELTSAAGLVPSLKKEIAANDAAAARITIDALRAHTATAKLAVDDPVWTLASAVPGLGSNFSAATEVARSADDVVNLALAPLVEVYGSLNWESLLPSKAGANLAPLETASPSISAAAHAVRLSVDKLQQIDETTLAPQVAEPLVSARNQMLGLTEALDAVANVSSIAPGMLGAQASRSYLLIIQNNSEARASGGIPGALAVLSFDKGKLTLSGQSSAGEVGVMSPPVSVDAAQERIYSARLGKYMQDVNLTPDFPTAASTARTMWERKTGQRVDGVISIDPVALSYILEATGPVNIKSPDLVALARDELPTELSGKNVVRTLLADVYAKIEQPSLQDTYFAGVAQEIFAALSDGKGNAASLIEGLTRGASEGRVLLWSGLSTEQSVIAMYALGGSIAGPSVAPAQFGVYFNDGTGAKMDYHVERTVQLLKECVRDGYEQTTVRITSTSKAPADAATSLPAYVTGAGIFGVPPGSVQTNIVAYGPVQANIETARFEGRSAAFAPYLHEGRPVGIFAVRLAPGETKTVDFTFSKIVQHTEPHLVVTPTVQPVDKVILPTQAAVCG